MCSSVPFQDLVLYAKSQKLTGAAVTGIKNYIDGTNRIHYGNLKRHANSLLHVWAQKNGSSDSQSQTATDSSLTTSDHENTVKKSKAKQESAGALLLKNNQTYYRILIGTALTVAEEELPIQKFGPLLTMQIRNGLKMLDPSVKSSSTACKEFIECLANVVRNRMKAYMKESSFYSLAADGSEARKTRDEKELVYLKLTVKTQSGIVPAIFLLRCQSMVDFGGTDSKALKTSMIHAVTQYVDDEELKAKLVSLCTDGAGVNFGKNSGALELTRNEMGWDIHLQWCLNHKLELALKDSFKQHKQFRDVKEI